MPEGLSADRLCQYAFEHAAVGMALVAPNGAWLRVNAALCEIVGYSAEELLQTNFQAITHPDDLALDLDHLHELLRGERLSYQIEKRYLHKQGRIVWILLNVAIVRNEQGEPQFVISQMTDVTERKESALRIQQTFVQALGELRYSGVEIERLRKQLAVVRTWSQEAGMKLLKEAFERGL